MDNPDDPQNWSPLHRRLEVSKRFGAIRNGPRQVISEAVVRDELAEQYGCKPEEVTPRQINLEIGSLAAHYGAIEIIPLAESKSNDTASEIERRANLLATYKAATGVEADKKIYEARNSGIHKPEFYKWRKGTLASTSATTANFERFLNEKKPPTKW